jgi:UDP:flavonoid glycosyltransferase YjiC (YdhE family)
MARVVIMTIGSYGDVVPYVGLGERLRAAGHDVRIAAN